MEKSNPRTSLSLTGELPRFRIQLGQSLVEGGDGGISKLNDSSPAPGMRLRGELNHRGR